MFETVFKTISQQDALIQKASSVLLHTTNGRPIPLSNIDYGAYHQAMDEHGAAEVAMGTYAGSVVMVINKSLLSFRNNVAATEDEWRKSAPLFDGCSVGQILEASANNVRHNDEWAKTRPPTAQQLKSIRVLSAALKESIAADGSDHRFAREISPETLQLVSGGNFYQLEVTVFTFAKNLMKQRRQRLPTQ